MRGTDGRAPVAVVTGVGREIGIGASVAAGMSEDGWNVATVGWRTYDDRMPWGADDASLARFEADFNDPHAPKLLMDDVLRQVGTVRALVLCHCESVDSDIQSTSVESFDRHMAVNARATWLLIREFANQFSSPSGTGRIISVTSDHTPGNLPYGASKGAMDRIVLAAAVELADLGVTANVINPGATDTGWMSPEIKTSVLRRNLQPRLGLPKDCSNLIRFLCSDQGQWVNGQLLYSDGGRLH
jgi:3-oxoacyl-[acyl-carrier protein] reductase